MEICYFLTGYPGTINLSPDNRSYVQFTIITSYIVFCGFTHDCKFAEIQNVSNVQIWLTSMSALAGDCVITKRDGSSLWNVIFISTYVEVINVKIHISYILCAVINIHQWSLFQYNTTCSEDNKMTYSSLVVENFIIMVLILKWFRE